MVNSEIFNLDVEYTNALNFYNAAQYAKKHGRKIRKGTGRKMPMYKVKRQLVYDNDGEISGAKYVRVPVEEYKTNVEQLYKIERPGSAWKKGTELTRDLGDDLKPVQTYHYEDTKK